MLSTFCFFICGCSKDKDKDISKKQLYASICNLNMQGVKEALKDHAVDIGSSVNLSSLRPCEVRKQEINNTIKGRRVKKSEKQK